MINRSVALIHNIPSLTDQRYSFIILDLRCRGYRQLLNDLRGCLAFTAGKNSKQPLRSFSGSFSVFHAVEIFRINFKQGAAIIKTGIAD